MRECPTREQLLRFVHGELSDAEVDDIGDHLEECGSCSKTVEKLEQQTDSFISDLRDAQQRDERDSESQQEEVIHAAAHLRQRELLIRCPHCHHAIALVEDDSLTEVTCPTCDSSFNVADDETILSSAKTIARLGRFELLQQVGSGAMGTVWKARDTKLDRTVAVKIPRRGMHSVVASEQFGREARAAAQLRHPNIVSIHEVETEQDSIYIVSDFVDGVTLAEKIATDRPSREEAATLCATIATALYHAHEAGVVHRDLKPSNIMLDASGQPHIMDFGLAKREVGEITMTIEGRILGTPAYMSPEQARGEGHKADPRSDVYSLGVILFELLTGERPFRGTTRMLLQQVLDDDAPSLRRLDSAIPRDLETICLKCLEKDREKRYPDAESLAAELQRFLRHEPVRARRVSWVNRGIRWARRNPLFAGLTSTIVALLVLIAVVASIAYMREAAIGERERRERQRAEENSAISEARRLAIVSKDALEEANILLSLKAVDATRGSLGYHLASAEQALRDSLTEMSGTPFDIKRVFGFSSRGEWVYAGEPLKMRDSPPLISVDHDDSQGKHAFSPDGKWLATFDSRGSDVSLFDLSSSTRPVNAISLQGVTGAMNGAVFSPNSRWLAMKTELDGRSKLLLWDLASADPFVTTTQLEGTVSGFSFDGRHLVTEVEAEEQSLLQVWNLAASKPAAASPQLEGLFGTIQRSMISLDGQRLFVIGYKSTEQKTVVQVWDLSREDASAGPTTLEIAEGVGTSQDGKRIFACTPAGELFEWDLSKAEQDSRTQLTGNEAPLRSAAFSTDCKWLFTSEYELVDRPKAPPRRVQHQQRLWNIANLADSPSPVLTMSHRQFRFTSTTSGQWFESITAEGAVEIWNLDDFQMDAGPIRLGPPEDRRYSLNQTTRSRDGRWMAAHTDGVCLLSISVPTRPSPTNTVKLKGTEQSECYAFSPDNRWFVTGNREEVRLFSVPATGNRLRSRTGTILAHFPTSTQKIDFTEDGNWLIVSSGSRARLWNTKAIDRGLEPIRLRQPRTPPPLVSQTFDPRVNDALRLRNPFMSPDRRWVATGRVNLHLWNLSGQDQFVTPYVLAGHQAFCPTIAFSPSSRWLATGSWDKTVRLWKLDKGQPDTNPTVLGGHEHAAYIVVFAPHDKIVITATDRTVRLWNILSDGVAPAPIVLDTGADFVTSVAVSPDGRWLATGHVEDGLPYRIWSHNEHFQTGIFATKLRLWDLSSPEPQLTEQIVQNVANTWVTQIEFSTDSQWLMTNTSARLGRSQPPAIIGPSEIRLWRIADRPQRNDSIKIASDDNVGGYNFTTAFSPDGRWLVVGDQISNRIQLWELRRDSAIIAKTLDSDVLTFQRPDSIAFSHDSRFLFALGASKVTRWDLRQAGKPKPHFFSIGSQQLGRGPLQLSPDNKHLFCSGLLWNLEKLRGREEPVRIAGEQADVAFSYDGKWVFTRDNNRSETEVLGRRLLIEDLMSVAREVAGRELTDREREMYFVED